MNIEDIWLTMPVEVLQEYLQFVKIDIVRATESQKPVLEKMKNDIVKRLKELNENTSSLQS